MKTYPTFDYQFYFQEPGVAEAELEKDIGRTLKVLIRSTRREIMVPALMVTAGKDMVLHPKMSKGMEEWIPQLRREHLEECGHWTQMERPAALNRILVEWLEGLPPDTPLPKISRL
ncbi:bifunctional epoxide hydrolase 2 [Limosa lapponica baueri]|uniref:Bifunctional epoxide hydrolase 2 n=1 Tax=Limosa lapponica baueri TaxID=1758121 RepID=A0A2I0T1M2_LIMLA|nr:bifunctional epoxide hydrolase 2 [Limosa lapponica baueri]